MSFESFKGKIIPLAAVLTAGCVDKPGEDISSLTCDELNHRIQTVVEDFEKYAGATLDGLVVAEARKETAVEELELVKRAKGCK